MTKEQRIILKYMNDNRVARGASPILTEADITEFHAKYPRAFIKMIETISITYDNELYRLLNDLPRPTS